MYKAWSTALGKEADVGKDESYPRKYWWVVVVAVPIVVALIAAFTDLLKSDATSGPATTITVQSGRS